MVKRAATHSVYRTICVLLILITRTTQKRIVGFGQNAVQ